MVDGVEVDALTAKLMIMSFGSVTAKKVSK